MPMPMPVLFVWVLLLWNVSKGSSFYVGSSVSSSSVSGVSLHLRRLGRPQPTGSTPTPHTTSTTTTGTTGTSRGTMRIRHRDTRHSQRTATLHNLSANMVPQDGSTNDNRGGTGIPVIVNGLPGPMALEAARACLDRGFNLLPFGFTGRSGKPTCVVDGKKETVNVNLIKGPGVGEGPDTMEAIHQLRNWKDKYPSLIVVDYTHPSAVLHNARVYCENDCDFVMGTTGEDPALLTNTVLASSATAVIAPNMAKQIVAMQAILQQMSSRFPGSFEGYQLSVVESHQSTKADTSGTAKAMVAYLGQLNKQKFEVDDIQKLRTPNQQSAFGVPEESLDGHAFHTYTMKSPDGSVTFEIKHNVCGRRVYAEGTADAVLFVNNMRNSPNKQNKRLFNMVDVLEAGML